MGKIPIGVFESDRPVPEIQFFGFVFEVMDSIAGQLSRLRYRSGGTYNAPVTIRSPFGGGVHTPEMHSDSLEGLMAQTPGLKVVVPSTPYDAKGLLIASIRDNDPVVFLEHLKLYRSFREEVPEEAYTIELGKADVKREGKDLSIITYGLMVHESLKAAEELEKEGYSVEVIDLRTIQPLDIDTIIASVEKTGRAIVVQEAQKQAGIAIRCGTVKVETFKVIRFSIVCETDIINSQSILISTTEMAESDINFLTCVCTEVNGVLFPRCLIQLVGGNGPFRNSCEIGGTGIACGRNGNAKMFSITHSIGSASHKRKFRSVQNQDSVRNNVIIRCVRNSALSTIAVFRFRNQADVTAWTFQTLNMHPAMIVTIGINQCPVNHGFQIPIKVFRDNGNRCFRFPRKVYARRSKFSIKVIRSHES